MAVFLAGQGTGAHRGGTNPPPPDPPPPTAVPGLYSTGVDNSGAPLPDGSSDPHYAGWVVVDSDRYPIGGSNPPWVADGSTSKWIGPVADQSHYTAQAGTYDYVTHFNLTGFNLSTVVITGEWSSDNNTQHIFINGTDTGFTNGATDYGIFTPFSITSGFVQGDNTLDFQIHEDGQGPTGLQVAMSGTGQLATNPPPAVPPTCNSCGCQGNADLISTAPGLCSSSASDGFSEAPVRYFDGTVAVGSTDLTSAGFGTSWGQSRSWTNGPGYASASFNGTGTVDSQLPTLLQANGGNTIIVVSNGTTARYFDAAGGNSFTPRYYDQTTLSYNPTTGQYLLTDTTGNQILFDGFGASIPLNQRGQFESLTDQAGNVTSVFAHTAGGTVQEVRRSTTVNSVTTIESYYYTYYGTGTQYAGLLQSVTLRRQVNGGSWTTIRQVAYTYYADSQSYGNGGDLKTATVEDGAGTALDTMYYRYYKPNDPDPNGYVHGLKYVFDSQSYARLVGAVANPLTATDAQVAPYATQYFEYDTSQRVAKEVAQEAGCTSCGGQGTFTFSYTTSTNSADFNHWTYKTVETLPDGNQNIVYCNYAGEVMLKAFVDQSSGLSWDTFTKYDGQGRAILTAQPSAVSGYNDTYADLLNNQNGNYQYLRDTSGLINTTDFYTMTTATESMPGGVAGYMADTKVQQGELGTAILLTGTQYYAHSASALNGGGTIYPEANMTVYRNTGGSGGETTSDSYQWYNNGQGVTTRMQSMTVSRPIVSGAENGPGTADMDTTVYDVYGRPIWHRDPDGFIDYTEYDPATSAVTKTIQDVDTTKTADFMNLPPGWMTPPGGGLHLMTTMTVDGLGRETKRTDPTGNITYTVYLDPDHAVRTYPGWQAATNLPTGPTQEVREVRPAPNSQNPLFTETLTMSAAPAVDMNNLPTGTESISQVQSLARSITNSGGQVQETDAYFSLGKLSYSVSPYLGTAGTNYNPTQFAYDARGRQDRVQSANGTINRTVYDGLGRVVSTWVGTNDTTTTLVDVHTAFNRTGIRTDGTSFADGGLDTNGHAYSASLLNGSVYWNTLPFTLGQPGTADAIAAAGQVLPLPTGSDRALSFLATAVNGSQTNQTFTVTYTDGSTQTLTQSLSDWMAPQNYPGEATALAMSYFNNANGTSTPQAVNLYAYTVALNPAKQVQSLTLPNNGNVVLLSATLTNRDWSPANNSDPSTMLQVTGNVYDGGGVGDSNLTQATQYPHGTRFDDYQPRQTSNYYDWRDRLVYSKQGVQTYEDNTTHRPITYSVYDNLDEVTQSQSYDGDGINFIGFVNGVPQPPSHSLLRAETDTVYDDQGRAYLSSTYNVDTGGNLSAYALTTNTWYNHRGQTVKTAAPGGIVHKMQYDGAGRETADFTTDGAGDRTGTLGWQDAQGVTSSNNVLTQTKTQYDGDGDPIFVTTWDRYHNSTYTGDLGMASMQQARVSFVGSFYDASDRLTAQVDYGNNGNSFLSSRPATVPTRGSSPALVTQYAYVADTVETISLVGSPSGNFTLSFNNQNTAGIPYNASAATVQNALQGIGALTNNVQVYGPSGGPWNVRFTGTLAGQPQPLLTGTAINYTVAVTYAATAGDAGRVQTVTDPRGIATKTDDDLLGRTTRTVAAFNVNPTFSNNWNQVTEYAYDGDNHVVLMTAYPGDGTFQQTQYVYNIQNTLLSGFISSYDLLSQVNYPDKTTGRPSTNPADQEFYQYDNLGEVRSMTQRTQTVHTYSYDVLGRPTLDAVGPFGAGVDQTVGSLATAYDTYGNPAVFTSYAPNGTTIVNQVQRTFNGLGQLTADAQYHGDPGNPNTPHGTVGYAYNLMAGGANNSRLLNMTYPNGRQVNYVYGTPGSVYDAISRVTGLADNGAMSDLEDLSYLGMDTVVQRAHPQTGINLTYIGTPGGDAGDQYVGLDRFGRVVSQNWLNTGTGLSTDNFAYGYDYDSNRLYQNNLISGEAALGELYHVSGSVDTYNINGVLTGAGYDVLNQMNAFNRGTLGGLNFSMVSNPTRTQQWTLDALGNWTALTTNIPSQNQTRQTNPQNELTQINGSTNLGYDSNGNTTMDDQGNGYVYDAWNRLVQATAGSTTEHFAYDALGRRIQEIEPNLFGDAVTRDLYFSAQWQVLEEHETSAGHYTNLVRAQCVWSPVYVDALVERDRDPAQYGSGSLSERLYVQQDADWNVTALVGQSGGTWQVVERYLYDPYGRPTDATGAQTGASDASWNFRGASQYGWVYLHQGGRYDTTTGLYNFRERDYSPTLGRWLQLDPLSYGAADVNLYRYLANAPTTNMDPMGALSATISGGTVGPHRLVDTRWSFTIDASGANVFNGSNGTDRSRHGVIIKVTTSRPQDIRFFQIVRSEIQVTARNGQKGYLNIRTPAKSGGKPSLLYTNPPDAPLWGLDAPSDRSKKYIRDASGKDYVLMRDYPGLEDYYKSFGRDFWKHDVCAASFKTFFRTFIEYKGSVKGEVDWQSSGKWNRIPQTLVGPAPEILGPVYRFYGYRITYVGPAMRGSSGFQRLLNTPDTRGPTSVLEDQLKAITGK